MVSVDETPPTSQGSEPHDWQAAVRWIRKNSRVLEMTKPNPDSPANVHGMMLIIYHTSVLGSLCPGKQGLSSQKSTRRGCEMVVSKGLAI